MIAECTKSFDEYEFHIAYRALNTFCVTDMSNFYLDIIKDRLYTYKKDSASRRSAQTVMYEILSALVRILAPMTCYTAEEIWEFMPHKDGETAESAMLVNWPEVNSAWDNEEVEEKWSKIISIKEAVAKELEEARAQKIIGHSLNAKVTLYVNGEQYSFLKSIEELLTTVLIVSKVVVEESKIKDTNDMEIKVEQAPGEKCERCWMYSETVGEDKEHPEIYHECSENLK